MFKLQMYAQGQAELQGLLPTLKTMIALKKCKERGCQVALLTRRHHDSLGARAPRADRQTMYGTRVERTFRRELTYTTLNKYF